MFNEARDSVPARLTPLETDPGCSVEPAAISTGTVTAPSVPAVPPPARVPPAWIVKEPVPIAEPAVFCRLSQPPLTFVPPV